ncbi:MAG TPA: hypothetical protein PK625_02730 [Spirochaetales bacterium]|nr:hypothetical protein [Spirochaetales bacterium]
MKAPRTLVLSAVLYAAVHLSALGQETWYSSNGAGMALDEMEAARALAQAWSLRISTAGRVTVATLFRQGDEYQSTRSEYAPNGGLARVAISQNGRIVEETEFLAGLPSVERRFLAGGSVEETKYTYQNNTLVASERSVDGRQVATVSYRYGPDGRLLSARENAGTRSGYGRSSSWSMRDGILDLRMYDEDGRLESYRRYRDSVLELEEHRTWNAGSLARVRRSEPETGILVEESYDDAGKLDTRVTTLKGQIMTTEHFTWTKDGLLARSEKTADGHRTVSTLTYDQDGSLAVELVELDGAPVSERRYSSATAWVDDAYDNGVLFARSWYENGRLVKEEIIRDGLTVRERTFP